MKSDRLSHSVNDAKTDKFIRSSFSFYSLEETCLTVFLIKCV